MAFAATSILLGMKILITHLIVLFQKINTETYIPEDSITFTSTQKVLWEYIKSNAIVQNHATLQFNQLDTTLIVSAKANLRITQNRQDTGQLSNSMLPKTKRRKSGV